MNPVLFWIFAALMLIFGALVVLLRNPVSSALSLVVSFIFLAALFISLDAFFIAIIQVLVYAGAVMVLFLFIIMLLDLKAEKRRKLNIPATVGGIAVSIGFGAIVTKVVGAFEQGAISAPALAEKSDDVRNVGMALFTNFNLPFQIIGVLVLIATIGVVVLSIRESK